MDIITVRSPFSSRITTPWGSHRIHGPLESILLDQGFPVDYELDEFNLPHTGTTLRHLQLWLCRLRRKIPLRHPATSSLGNIFWRHSHFSPQTTRTTHSLTTTTFLSLTSKHDFATPMATISLSHIQQCLNLATHISLRQIAAKIPSQLHNDFLPSFLPYLLTYFLRDLQHKRKTFIHAAIKTIIKTFRHLGSSLIYLP